MNIQDNEKESTESSLKKKTIKITLRYHITMTLTECILKVIAPHAGKAAVKSLSQTLFMGV